MNIYSLMEHKINSGVLYNSEQAAKTIDNFVSYEVCFNIFDAFVGLFQPFNYMKRKKHWMLEESLQFLSNEISLETGEDILA